MYGRGGVEDTRLEAKAKDTKKSQAKDTNASVFLRKQVLKIFFGRSPKKKNVLEKHFSADLQNFNHSKNSAVLEPRTGQFSRT